jgi:hypothetical protein
MNRASLEGRKIPGGVAQPGGRQEILGKLSIPFVALLSLYSPNCVEGMFSEVRPGAHSNEDEKETTNPGSFLAAELLRTRHPTRIYLRKLDIVIARHKGEGGTFMTAKKHTNPTPGGRILTYQRPSAVRLFALMFAVVVGLAIVLVATLS